MEEDELPPGSTARILGPRAAFRGWSSEKDASGLTETRLRQGHRTAAPLSGVAPVHPADTGSLVFRGAGRCTKRPERTDQVPSSVDGLRPTPLVPLSRLLAHSSNWESSGHHSKNKAEAESWASHAKQFRAGPLWALQPIRLGGGGRGAQVMLPRGGAGRTSTCTTWGESKAESKFTAEKTILKSTRLRVRT